jgi:uracil phosphoribosyltransferase
LIYVKLPHDIKDRKVLLMDPMLATGGSACRGACARCCDGVVTRARVTAVSVLVEQGVKEQNIIFLNLIAAPEGIKAMMQAYPNVRIITSMIDEKLNEKSYILPGIGDFGDR